ncbi:MAG: class I SAM-dependent methyltransferase [Candidatus Brocadiales bacterium]|nr:class I SAM-dependent methyltransferase [Candidatus Brocadiales bacterium]
MKYPTKSKCPYCHSEGKHLLQILSRCYHRCPECDLIYIYTVDNYENKARIEFYKNEYYKIYSKDQRSGYRRGLNGHILDLIESRKGNGRLLDVGAGLGFFLDDAQKRGWQIYGIELSKESSEKAIELLGKKIFNGTLKEYKGDRNFDAVTFINVLGHLPEPWQEIKNARNQIKPQGLIYLRFPNGLMHTLVFRVASRFRVTNLISKYLVFHEYCFTKKNIQRLLNDLGFERIVVVNSIPSEGDPYRLFQNYSYARNVKKLVSVITSLIYILSARKILLGASLEVTALKK